MIVTVTANPSIDISLTVDELQIGEVNRATSVRRDPAGKGVNVARALTVNGVDAVALFPADSFSGARLKILLDQQGVASHTVPIEQAIRNNITILDPAGTTKVNEAGPQVTADEAQALLDAIESKLAAHPAWIVLSGSTPPGIGPDWCVTVGELARRYGVPFAADLSGADLAAVVAAGVATVIKPNDEELEELIGSPVHTVDDVVKGVRGLLKHPDSHAVISLGRNGALLVTADKSWWAGSAPVTAVSTVGAGDSTLAGYLSVASDDYAERLKTGVAWGSAAVTLPGTQAPGPADIDVTTVRVVAEPNPSTEIGDLAK